MIFLERPADFKLIMRIVACYVIFRGRHLVLHRQLWKPEGGTWGAPGGKVKGNEELLAAILREAGEETGIAFDSERMCYCRVLHVRYAKGDFEYHVFSYELDDEPKIVLASDEHQAYRFVTPKEALALPLIQDEDTSIKIHFGLA